MRRLLALAVLTAAVSGCSTHQCDASTSTFDGGTVTQDNGLWVWQTSSIEAGWIPFQGQETITFTLPSDFPPFSTPGFMLFPLVSTAPGQDAGLFAWGAGQLAEYQITGPRTFTVLNGACADYYLRVVVIAPALTGATIDAGADATHD